MTTLPTNETYPTRAYDLLDESERKAVEDYVQYIVAEQQRKNQRIDLALNLPIPSEYIKRSRGALLRPVPRAALAERIMEESNTADISPSRVIKELAKIAFSDITDYMCTGAFGSVDLKQLQDIPADKAGAIKSIETKIGQSGSNSKITMHDKLPALRALSEMMGITAPEQGPVLKEYVKQEIRKATKEEIKAPEAEYVELLEHAEKLETK